MREAVRGASRSAALAALLVPLLAAAPRASAVEGAFPLVDPRLGPLVLRTVERAAEKLAAPGCTTLLDEFSDVRTGQPLRATLAGSGREPGDLFASLHFVDADHMVQCRQRKTWAWIPVGSDVVFVCTSRFVSLVKKDEWLAGNVLVHEALHSLGLGENPPSSEEITERVVRRCGR